MQCDHRVTKTKVVLRMVYGLNLSVIPGCKRNEESHLNVLYVTAINKYITVINKYVTVVMARTSEL